MTNATIDQLKHEWDVAKKIADSLSIDFRSIEAARKHQAEARTQYQQAVVRAEEATYQEQERPKSTTVL